MFQVSEYEPQVLEDKGIRAETSTAVPTSTSLAFLTFVYWLDGRRSTNTLRSVKQQGLSPNFLKYWNISSSGSPRKKPVHLFNMLC